MSLGEKIKKRREELGLSQEDLALMLGYKSRSSIAKIEADINDLTQSKIVAFSEALCTTPAYLMGWTDDPINYDDPSITSDIPLEILKEADGNTELAYKAHQARLKDSKQNSNNSIEVENPDIRQIARAGKKMTPEQAKNVRKYAEFMYPEAFKNDR